MKQIDRQFVDRSCWNFPERNSVEEECTGLVYLFCTNFNNTRIIRIYAKKADFTEAQIDALRKTPFGCAMRVHAAYEAYPQHPYSSLVRYCVVLSKPVLPTEWCVLVKDVEYYDFCRPIANLPCIPRAGFTLLTGKEPARVYYNAEGNTRFASVA